MFTINFIKYKFFYYVVMKRFNHNASPPPKWLRWINGEYVLLGFFSLLVLYLVFFTSLRSLILFIFAICLLGIIASEISITVSDTVLNHSKGVIFVYFVFLMIMLAYSNMYQLIVFNSVFVSGGLLFFFFYYMYAVEKGEIDG